MNAKEQSGGTRTIVVGVDYEELGDLALERACGLAQTHPEIQVHVAHVDSGAVVHETMSAAAGVAVDLGEASKRLHAHVEQVVKRWCEARDVGVPFVRLTTHVRVNSPPAAALAQLASDVEADLVIVGTHGRKGARRVLLGSVAEGVVRKAPCEVLVVRPRDASVPEIQPPCPRCLEARRASNGQEMWCDQHREEQERRHTYHYRGAAGPHQSGFLIHS